MSWRCATKSHVSLFYFYEPSRDMMFSSLKSPRLLDDNDEIFVRFYSRLLAKENGKLFRKMCKQNWSLITITASRRCAFLIIFHSYFVFPFQFCVPLLGRTSLGFLILALFSYFLHFILLLVVFVFSLQLIPYFTNSTTTWQHTWMGWMVDVFFYVFRLFGII